MVRPLHRKALVNAFKKKFIASQGIHCGLGDLLQGSILILISHTDVGHFILNQGHVSPTRLNRGQSISISLYLSSYNLFLDASLPLFSFYTIAIVYILSE